jgi:EmrB/QacA subfamily drug resistance transporter
MSETVAVAPARAKLGRDTWLAIVAMGLAVFVIANDVTAMSVALPAIENDFDSDVSVVQWVVNAYALIFGVLIVTGGRLADMFGRRRILFIGAAIFALFSVLGGLAPNVGILIACRALMGIGGAMMWPAILGLVYAILPEDRASLGGALVIGTAGIGNAMGPMLGGALTDAFSWRWILFLNLPIAGIACLVTWRTVHVPNPTDRSRIDYGGIATISIGLVALLMALGQAPDEGWTSPVVLGAFALSAVLLIAFVFIERSMRSDALVPGDVMSNGNFVSACIATLLMSATFFAALLYLPQFFQKILDYSPVEAGAALLPLMGTFALTSFVAGRLYDRFGPKVMVTVGGLCIALGPLLWSRIQPDSSYTALVPGMLVAGVGIGLFYSSVTTAGVTSLDQSRSSLAGGILYMFQVAGGAVGLGITTTLFLVGANNGLAESTQDANVDLTSAEAEAVRGVLAGTDSSQQVIETYAGGLGDQLVDLVRDAFAMGLRWAFLLDGILALIGALVGALFVGGSVFKRRRANRAVIETSSAATG